MLASIAFLLATPVDAMAYEERRLDGHVSASTARVIDGLPYFDDGLLEGGLAFNDPSGWTAGLNIALGEGNGSLLPQETVGVLETHLGWGQSFEKSFWHVALFDYRLDAASPGADASKGIRLTAGYGNLSTAFSFESDMPMYLASLDRFIPYDNRRMELQWTDSLTRDVGWSAGLGYRDVDRLEIGYGYATISLVGEFRQVHWQLALFAAENKAKSLYYGSEADTRSLLLRITLPFRIF